MNNRKGEYAKADMRDIERMAEAAELISTSDVASVMIRVYQHWAILPDFGLLSSVAPCMMAQGG